MGRKQLCFVSSGIVEELCGLERTVGLYFYDGITTHPVGETEIFGTQVYSIVEKNNRLFIGSNNGLLTYDYASGQVNVSDIDSPKRNQVFTIDR